MPHFLGLSSHQESKPQKALVTAQNQSVMRAPQSPLKGSNPPSTRRGHQTEKGFPENSLR